MSTVCTDRSGHQFNATPAEWWPVWQFADFIAHDLIERQFLDVVSGEPTSVPAETAFELAGRIFTTAPRQDVIDSTLQRIRYEYGDDVHEFTMAQGEAVYANVATDVRTARPVDGKPIRGEIVPADVNLSPQEIVIYRVFLLLEINRDCFSDVDERLPFSLSAGRLGEFATFCQKSGGFKVSSDTWF